MSDAPDLNELLPDDVSSDERERLRRVHELLVAVGPPPELSPTLAEPRARPRRESVFARRRYGVLALAASLVVAAFVGGYAVGFERGSFETDYTVEMRGTAAAPRAYAVLNVGPKDASGNWPMEMSVRGLQPLPEGSYYELYLTKNGRPAVSCGRFRVHPGTTTVPLNAPYRFKQYDGWIVTRETPGRPDDDTVLLTTERDGEALGSVRSGYD